MKLSEFIIKRLNKISVFEICGVIYKGYLLVAAMSAVIGLSAFISVLASNDMYRATALVVPVISGDMRGFGTEIGIAAQLFGINLNGVEDGDQNRVSVVIATMRATEFLMKFIQDRDLQEELINDRNIYFSEVVNPISLLGRIKGLVIQTPVDFTREHNLFLVARPPPMTRLERSARRLHEMIEVQTYRNDLLAVSLTWKNPEQARDWVNWLVEDVNNLFKEQDVMEAKNALNYLKKQVELTSVVELEEVLYDMIKAQTQKIMLADIKKEYVLEVIDPALTPRERLNPYGVSVVIAGMFVGVILSAGFLLFRHYYKQFASLQSKDEEKGGDIVPR